MSNNKLNNNINNTINNIRRNRYYQDLVGLSPYWIIGRFLLLVVDNDLFTHKYCTSEFNFSLSFSWLCSRANSRMNASPRPSSRPRCFQLRSVPFWAGFSIVINRWWCQFESFWSNDDKLALSIHWRFGLGSQIIELVLVSPGRRDVNSFDFWLFLVAIWVESCVVDASLWTLVSDARPNEWIILKSK